MLVRATLRSLRISPIKLNYVARLIRGKKAHEAMNLLQFCRKRISIDVRKCLLSAVSNAEWNHSLDIDKLWVQEAYVGKAMALRRMMPRAKGRGNAIKKPFSHLYIVLGEK